MGDYLDLADTVLLLEEYRPREATLEAKAIAQAHPTGRAFGESRYPLAVASRAPLPESFDPRRGRKARVKGRGLYYCERYYTFPWGAAETGATEHVATRMVLYPPMGLKTWINCSPGLAPDPVPKISHRHPHITPKLKGCASLWMP